ncbi:10917_t:CDS:2 [Diversispora eburnea]|uniref:10917_t:CDS:1 n=1 Tax=Diversispora eburnea TaxID=1213867 RepID=A0A9N8UVX5_9GLOM|nr:10917_t:CDS:2 [Diversispora eburnea]
MGSNSSNTELQDYGRRLSEASNISNNNNKDGNIEQFKIKSIISRLPPPPIPLSQINSTNLDNRIRDAIIKKQNRLIELIKSVWPQLRAPSVKFTLSNLSVRALERRKMISPLMLGSVTIRNGQQMVLSATVKTTKYVKIDNFHKPMVVTDLCDPKIYFLKHYKFIITKILPKLSKEVTIVQQQPGLFLTVKEVKMRKLEIYKIFECKLCSSGMGDLKIFTYDGILKHLQSPRHLNLKSISEEDQIKINLKEYILAFSENLPPKIEDIK